MTRPLAMVREGDPTSGPGLLFDDVPFRGIVEQALAGMYVVLDERFVYANDTFAAMFGYQKDDFIGRRMVDCVTADSVDEVMRNYRRRISGEVDTIHYFTKGLRKDGEVVHLELHASRVECRGQPALAGVALDVTARVKVQEELSRSRERLRELAQHINRTRESERARLSREVHDVLGGMLTSIKFDLSRIVRRTSAAGQEELNTIAGELLTLVQETVDTARSIADELRPTSLDLLGLGAALVQLLSRFQDRYDIEAVLEGREHCDGLDESVATQVFRIVQEGLTNVARHAQAKRVRIVARRTGRWLELTLHDDGTGIDGARLRKGSIGLFSMQERAREIDAAVQVMPAPDGGTLVCLRVPLAQ